MSPEDIRHGSDRPIQVSTTAERLPHLVRLPHIGHETQYQPCCGKLLCCGCLYEAFEADREKRLIPFCRTPYHTSDIELTKRIRKRIEANDDSAIYTLACFYRDGLYGVPENQERAMELFLRAGKLGNLYGHFKAGFNYMNGLGVQRNMNKAVHYFELAAMGGVVEARPI